MFTITCLYDDVKGNVYILFFYSYYKVTYFSIVCKYWYVVCVNIHKLYFCDSCVVSQSKMCNYNGYDVTCETLQALQ